MLKYPSISNYPPSTLLHNLDMVTPPCHVTMMVTLFSPSPVAPSAALP